MACGVAIKRSLDLDPHHSPECVIKRQRTGHCSPFAASSMKMSQFAEVPSPLCRLSQDDIKSYVKEEINQLKRRKLIPIRRRLVANDPPSPSSGSQSSDSESESNSGNKFRQAYMASTASAELTTPNVASAPATSTSADEPQFTLKQVELICNRLLSEQEVKLRTEYEQILETKLAEQYETFVHFTNDQIHRRFEDISLSYVS